MSKLESVNFCYICDLAFETRKQFIKHNLSDEHLNSARKEMEDETMERVYDSEEYFFFRPKTETKGASPLVPQPKTEGASPLVPQPKDNTKDIIKTKPIIKPKTKTEDSIYS